jgi:hypothetical protein
LTIPYQKFSFWWYFFKTSSYFIDAFNKSKANWMRYVNCARNEDEQNLIAYQYKGEIYYRSFKEIPPETELLVWYGQDYGKDLGIAQFTYLIQFALDLLKASIK